MTGLEYAILGLQQALDAPRGHAVWRGLVRNRMSGVSEQLSAEGSRGGDEWLAARETGLLRERDALQARLSLLGPQVRDVPDTETVRADLRRLVTDLERHRQHLNDLVYDSVALDIGGSE